MEEAPFDPASLQGPEDGPLAKLAWYLLVLGIIAILIAGFFFFKREIRYSEYYLNGTALGRYFLYGGIASYATGRIITYWQRFGRKKRPTTRDD